MIAIREGTPADAHGIASVQVRGWHTTYKGIVPDEFLSKMSIDVQEKRQKEGFIANKRKQRLFVAENENDEIVGYIIGGENRYSDEYPDISGELYAIYILENVQYGGLGKRLVYTLVEWLRENDFSNMLVWVLAENSAIQFYKKLGADYLGRKRLEISNKSLDEHVYVWDTFNRFD